MPAPRLTADSKSLNEDKVTSVYNVLTNDLDATTVTQVKSASGSFIPITSTGTTIVGTYGVLTIKSDGSWTYDSTTAQSQVLGEGIYGHDVFTYTATSATGETANSTLTMNVYGRNDAPVITVANPALNPIAKTEADNGGQTVASFLRSTDKDAGALSGIALTGLAATHGVWQYSLDQGATWLDVGIVSSSAAMLLRSTDLIRYRPDGTDAHSASFTFRAWDQSTGVAGTKVAPGSGGGLTAYSSTSGTGSLTVTDGGGPTNQAPVATDDSITTATDTAVLIDALANDQDADGDALTIASTTNAAHGSLTLQEGKILYTPAAGFFGTDTFDYIVSDGQSTSDAGTVTITVRAPPVATDDSATVTVDTPKLIDVLANDTDPDGPAISITALTQATNGTVSIQQGKVLYTPDAGYVGADSFTYTISDGQGGSDTGAVAISVGAPPPTSAVTVTFQQGGNGYTGAVDTMVKQANSTIDYGKAYLLAPETESGAKVQGLLAFNNLFGSGPGQIPVGATIISATLTLSVTNGSANAGSLYPMLANWNASSTWNSLGAGVQIGTEASSSNATVIGKIGIGNGSFDVTASLKSWMAASSTSTGQNAANKGWLLDNPGTDSWNFETSDSTAKPSLVITYVPAGSPLTPTVPTVSVKAPTTLQMENSDKISFTVSLSQAATQDVTVTFATSNITAQNTTDYVATQGSITFLAGETTKVVDVTLRNDTAEERTESFALQLTSATNAKIGTITAVGHITDDDLVPGAMPAITASVVAVRNLADGKKYLDGSGNYGIGDPSAIAYIPGTGQLLIGDSEHDESPYRSSINMFAIRTDGTYVRNYSLTSYTKEPTGLAYNSNDGFLYVADDNTRGVFRVDPANPSVKLAFFDTLKLGMMDTEDLKVDPVTGHLHILDGKLLQLLEVTTTGTYVDSISLPTIMKDAEALAYDPAHDIFFVGSGASPLIWAMDRQGNILATIDVLTSYNAHPKGFELAPSSNPNDGDTLSLYVVDYGADQVNDGRLFEINLGSGWLF